MLTLPVSLLSRILSGPVFQRGHRRSFIKQLTFTACVFTQLPRRAVSDVNMSSLEELKFDNRALKSLPIDIETKNYVRSVAGSINSQVNSCL